MFSSEVTESHGRMGDAKGLDMRCSAHCEVEEVADIGRLASSFPSSPVMKIRDSVFTGQCLSS